MATGFAGLDTRHTWEWSEAREAIAAIEADARSHGIRYEMFEATTFGDREKRVLVVAYCIKHDWPIAPDSVCEVCLRQS